MGVDRSQSQTYSNYNDSGQMNTAGAFSYELLKLIQTFNYNDYKMSCGIIPNLIELNQRQFSLISSLMRMAYIKLSTDKSYLELEKELKKIKVDIGVCVVPAGHGSEIKYYKLSAEQINVRLNDCLKRIIFMLNKRGFISKLTADPTNVMGRFE